MARRLRSVAVLLIACVAALAGLADAAPSTSAFAALTTDLEARAAGYAPPLTAAARREKRAIDQSLARLAKPHADLVADAKSAAFVAGALKRGFPKEFRPATAQTDLANLVAGVFRDLIAAGEAEYGRLEEALGAVSDPAARTAATAKLQAVRRALNRAAKPAASPSTAAAQLALAVRVARQGLAIARPYVDGFLTAKINGRTVAAASVRAHYHSSFSGVLVTAELLTPESAPARTLQIVVQSPAVGTHEIGAFSLGSTYALYFEGAIQDDAVWYSQFTEPMGRVDLTEYDPANGRVAGTFSFLTMRDGNSVKKFTSGRFVATDVIDDAAP